MKDNIKIIFLFLKRIILVIAYIAYPLISLGLFSYLFWHCFFNNSTLDIQLHDTYFVIPIGFIFGPFMFIYGFNLYNIYKNYAYTNKIVILVQSLVLSIMIALVSNKLFYTGRRYVTGLTEEQYFNYQREEMKILTLLIFSMLLIVIASEIVNNITIRKRKLALRSDDY